MKLIFLCAVVGCFSSVAFAQHTQPLESSTQLLVVTTADWNAVSGTLQRYQRADAHARWKIEGAPITVVVGKNGLGWGVGEMPPIHPSASDPIKKEGDGKAPAGIFPLLSTFGYAPQTLPDSKMPYITLAQSVECVDDVHSQYYNRVLDRASVVPDWNSSEKMRRPDELYTWGIVVGHNSAPVAPGAGSCIFLHIWKGAGIGTVGCTAMPMPQVERVIAWLDPSRKPLLVQLPMAQYREYQKHWKLPPLPRP
jgi:D-alanyl-D-alanine dipeptidase